MGPSASVSAWPLPVTMTLAQKDAAGPGVRAPGILTEQVSRDTCPRPPTLVTLQRLCQDRVGPPGQDCPGEGISLLPKC